MRSQPWITSTISSPSSVPRIRASSRLRTRTPRPPARAREVVREGDHRPSRRLGVEQPPALRPRLLAGRFDLLRLRPGRVGARRSSTRRRRGRSSSRFWAAYNDHLARVMRAIPDAVRLREHTRHNLDRLAWQPVPAGQPMTLDYFMRDYVGHLQHHLRQIDAMRLPGGARGCLRIDMATTQTEADFDQMLLARLPHLASRDLRRRPGRGRLEQRSDPRSGLHRRMDLRCRWRRDVQDRARHPRVPWRHGSENRHRLGRRRLPGRDPPGGDSIASSASRWRTRRYTWIGRYYRWTIHLNWPAGGMITFGAVGFTQTWLARSDSCARSSTCHRVTARAWSGASTDAAPSRSGYPEPAT